MALRFDRKWTPSITEGRECGSCYACCVHLGIDELKKWSGQTCKHLHGGKDPTKRCTIYSNRPEACSRYECLWKSGGGPDDLRPNESGMIITGYASETPGRGSVTIIIIDEKQAYAHNVQDVVVELLMLPTIDEVRIVNPKTKRAQYYKDGVIYNCKLLPPEGYESLIFSADTDKIAGKYYVQTEE